MIIITDCQYRMSISAIRYFGKLGKKVIAVSTKKDPPSFYSKYVTRRVTLSGEREEYIKELYALCGDSRPVILPIGVFTLNILAENRELFETVADFCVASPDTLAAANDKSVMLGTARELCLDVPKEYSIDSSDLSFPLVVKPICGEKHGLKAKERYIIVNDRDELIKAYDKFSAYGKPIVEEYIDGDGVGVNMLFDKKGNLAAAFCHRRIHEYPISGGPSASCVSFYDEKLINSAKKLLYKIGFSGPAMAEFKEKDGKYYLLEINPRIWGSFPLFYHAKSDFCALYERASRGETFDMPSFAFKSGVKMKFTANDIMAALQYLKGGKIGKAFGVLLEILNPAVRDGIFSLTDPRPFFKYIFGDKKA